MMKTQTDSLLSLVIAYCVILIFLSLILGLSGCASAPVSNLGDITKGETGKTAAHDFPAQDYFSSVLEKEKEKLLEGCTQSTLAKPGDQYSYQGNIDPQTIYNEWVEILNLREGDYRMGAMCYKNPDFNADITAAELVMQAGVCAAFCYLQDGEPMAFIYDPASACYVEMEMDGGQKKKFVDRLLEILYANSTAI